MEQITERLQTHMMIEEAIFYPAVQEVANSGKNEELVPEAYEEHHVVKLVLDELPDVDPEDERFKAKMTVLSELVDHHVQEEEKELFKVAEKLGKDRLEELGAEMEAEAGMSPDENPRKTISRSTTRKSTTMRTRGPVRDASGAQMKRRRAAGTS
jgi:iron-sulfur cluster repair protein YtfE (RIC family)